MPQLQLRLIVSPEDDKCYMDKGSDKYIHIPNWVLITKGLTCTDKLLYGQIYSLSQKYKFCTAGNKYLSKRLGIEIKTVQNSLRRMEKMGIIIRDIYLDKRVILVVENKGPQIRTLYSLNKGTNSLYKEKTLPK